MKHIGTSLIIFCLLLLPLEGLAQSSNITEKLSEKPAPVVASKVTSVYGISADDYLPTVESARRQLRPQFRKQASRCSFDLPDAFYYIGGPIFFLLFLRVLVIFLNGFEEKRKEDQRAARREIMDVK